MPRTSHTTATATRLCIAFILASGFLATCFAQEEPPADLMVRIARRETANAAARNDYTYRQSVTVSELNTNGAIAGEYKEARDVIFSPSQERTESFVGKPWNGLQRLKLTDEDFRDIREVQPFLLTTEQAFLYDKKYRGEESMDGIDCYVVSIRPRQILDRQRLFDGMLWVAKSDYSIVRSEGQAVPQIMTMKSENLFPHFTTIRQKVDNAWWFPLETYADDTLYFRGGPIRVRMRIRYLNYKRFTAESTVRFEK